MPDPKVVLDGDDMRRTLTRIAHEIVENAGEPEQLALVGIHRRGAVLAARLRELVCELHAIEVPLGDLDIAFYRDDVTLRGGTPVVYSTHLDFDIDGLTVVIVDDVLFTGRTVRSRPSSTTGAPSASSSPCWPTAAIASCRSAPTTWARTCRRRAASASTCASQRSTARTA
jgi:hypoxanthine-guanine phosphoribosyltransferase